MSHFKQFLRALGVMFVTLGMVGAFFVTSVPKAEAYVTGSCDAPTVVMGINSTSEVYFDTFMHCTGLVRSVTLTEYYSIWQMGQWVQVHSFGHYFGTRTTGYWWARPSGSWQWTPLSEAGGAYVRSRLCFNNGDYTRCLEGVKSVWQ